MDKEYFKYLLDAMRYVQSDTLGGCGSRGCGQIEFRELTITDLDGSKETMEVLA